MNLRAIREDLAAVAQEAGFNSWSVSPDDPQDLPAAVVGGIQNLVRLNRLTTQIQIGITFYVSLAEPVDATARLDLALSVGETGSFIDLLDSVHAEDGAAWRSVRFVSAGPYTRFTMPGGGAALGVEVQLELTA